MKGKGRRQRTAQAEKAAVTVKQMQAIDRRAIDKTGIPSLVLMENAGRGVAQAVRASLKGRARPRVAVVCGLGNNAGDGFVAARHLLNAGVRTEIFLAGSPRRLKQDALINYMILKRSGFSFGRLDGKAEHAWGRIRRVQIIVDAVFGVGLSREIREPYYSIIDHLNCSRAKILAVDIPSGLDGTTGRTYGICVRAFKTVTFHRAKKGFFRNAGPEYTGKIVVADIGIP